MKRIIIIEDEAIIAIEIQSTLEDLGYKVVGRAMNGDRALDLLANTPCDLVLLDIHIKGTRSGIDLAHLINEKYQIPFVFITSFADTATVAKASETMPYGYIVKPFTDKDLRSNIAVALARAASEEKKNAGLDFAAIEQLYEVRLSERDRDVLKLFVEGNTYNQVANQLEVSVNTVKTYQKRLYTIFQVDSKLKLVDKVRSI